MPNLQSAIDAFHKTAETHAFYQTILAERGVVASDIVDEADFVSRVPIIKKEDVFSRFSVAELVSNEVRNSYISAIVSSGTSGTFSFGLVTPADLEKQRQMIDQMLNRFFNAEVVPPIIINALPMGVSFVSSYPVIPTSVRTDIALKTITTLGADRPVVLITDPHVLKKLLEEGVEAGVDWGAYTVSAVIGGQWSSDSYKHYVLSLLNPGYEFGKPVRNQIYETMGVTEVGLNLFAATPDLAALRSLCQTATTPFFFTCKPGSAVPTLMYVMSQSVVVEVVNPDEAGVGDLVLTQLDPHVSPSLIRYATGDKIQMVDSGALAALGITPALSLPIVALWGRDSEKRIAGISVSDVLQWLYEDHIVAGAITGHFEMVEKENQLCVRVQLRPHTSAPSHYEKPGISFEWIPHHDFLRDTGVSYDHKWKHTS